MAAIAFDFGGTRVKALLTEQENILNQVEHPVQDNTSFLQLLPWMGETVTRLLDSREEAEVKGIGVAYPGIVDTRQMRVLSRYVKYSDIHDFDFVKWAKSKWKLPFVMENDARAALAGEWQYGAGRGSDNLFMMTMGTGIGTAVLINGHILRGAHYLAGNVGGHMSINYHGKMCNCGHTGCLETIASTWALPEIVRSHPGYADSKLSRSEELSFKALFNLREEDELAHQILEDCFDAWGVALVNFIHAFDPERIILSGGIVHAGHTLLDALKTRLVPNSWTHDIEVALIPAHYPDFAGALGMGWLVETYAKQKTI